MRTVGIKALKNSLSEYIRAVAAGETVLVTDRGHVVAELVPPAAARSAVPPDAMFAEMVRQGWISLPSMPAEGIPPRRPIGSFEDLMSELRQDRDDR